MVSVMAERRPLQLEALAGRKLEYVRLDSTVVLGLSGGGQVVIETPALLVGADGPFAVLPGVTSSEVLATLLGDTVRTARARDTGELEIGFAGGARLLVGADDDYESWAVIGPDGLLIVCLAGGELAVWG
ncbi:hypothetical protein Ato02nite_001860 [Paractinoplanes toevensis]|uniref:Uncharacterized protein n=2 Tax=Paractinoplanes toevensis TaxID=571911 RepID=A0A919T3U6_9ACTN|nr:hypothetical protein Ato02nite_001860 [Actinoplanes toevensis]